MQMLSLLMPCYRQLVGSCIPHLLPPIRGAFSTACRGQWISWDHGKSTRSQADEREYWGPCWVPVAPSKSSRKNSFSKNSAAAAPLMAMLMSHIQETMKPAELAAHLGLSSQYVRTACHRAKTPSIAPGLLDVKQQHQREGKLACHEAVQEIITDFFVQETCIFSGQNNNLWRLLKQKKELRFRFVATNPQLLRDFMYHHVTADGLFVREEGVVWFKMMSDSAVVYQLHDLLPREGKYMCEQCSNAVQVPLFHVLPADCPRTTMPVNLEKQRAALVTPDPSRAASVLRWRPRSGRGGPRQARAMRAPGWLESFRARACSAASCITPQRAAQTATWLRITRSRASRLTSL
jgi:hypothetical protein